GAGYPDRDVHGDVRHRPHRRLGLALAGTAERSGKQDRPPAPDLYRFGDARLSRDGPALIARCIPRVRKSKLASARTRTPRFLGAFFFVGPARGQFASSYRYS